MVGLLEVVGVYVVFIVKGIEVGFSGGGGYVVFVMLIVVGGESLFVLVVFVGFLDWMKIYEVFVW